MTMMYETTLSTEGSADINYDITLDLTITDTVGGRFTFPPEFFPVISFSALSQPLGTLDTFNGSQGVWSFTADASAAIGQSVVFMVTGLGYLTINGVPTLVSVDQDLVTITFTCFAEGTRIATPGGERAIETLAPGDLVITRDHGPLPVRWAGHRHLRAPGDLGAIVFAPGALGNPRELRVSPEHRMLVTGWRAEVLAGEAEVLVPARALVNGDTIWQDRVTPVTWHHILFDTHQIVMSEGIPSESYHPDAQGLADLSPAAREEVLSLFPELATDPASHGGLARPVLDGAGAWMVMS